MTATVLVPLDGSDKDERAFPIAVNFAHLANGAVHLIRVLDESANAESGEAGAHAADPSRRPRAITEQRVREAADRLVPVVQQPVTWEVADGPDVPAVLLQRAEQLNADLVVMATRAPSAVGRAIHGSVADRIVRESARPVVLVPPGAHFLRGKQVHLGRILVPLDGSDAALQVLTTLLRLPRVNELELVLLEVVAPGWPTDAEPADAPGPLDLQEADEDEELAPEPGRDHSLAEQAERRLEAVAAGVRARGADAEVRIVEADDPAAIIIAAVRQELVDLIAMTTRGASGLERLVLGSVATGVVRRSEVSVLLVRPT